MKVKIFVFIFVAALVVLMTATAAFAVEDQIENVDLPEGYWDFLCPTGSKAVLDTEGLPLLDDDCIAEFLPQGAIGAAGDDLTDGEIQEIIEKCVVCEQITELTQQETPTVQDDAYTEAATATRSSMPSTGFILLPAAALLAAGAGIMLNRKRS